MEGNPSLGKFWPLVGRFSAGWRIKPETLARLVLRCHYPLANFVQWKSRQRPRQRQRQRQRQKQKRSFIKGKRCHAQLAASVKWKSRYYRLQISGFTESLLQRNTKATVCSDEEIWYDMTRKYLYHIIIEILFTVQTFSCRCLSPQVIRFKSRV